MGVTMRCRKKGAEEYDFGCGRFIGLRRTVAKEILQDKFDIYEDWFITTEETSKDVLHQKCEALWTAAGAAAYDFFTQSDCGGKLTLKQVKEIYAKIKDSKEDFSMCYAAWYTEEHKSDFLNLCKECIEAHRGLEWY